MINFFIGLIIGIIEQYHLERCFDKLEEKEKEK